MLPRLPSSRTHPACPHHHQASTLCILLQSCVNVFIQRHTLPALAMTEVDIAPVFGAELKVCYTPTSKPQLCDLRIDSPVGWLQACEYLGS